MSNVVIYERWPANSNGADRRKGQ